MRRHKPKLTLTKWCIAVTFLTAIVAIPALIGTNCYLAYGTREYVTVTVSDKERIVSNSSSYYLVFTEHEVFQNSDTLLCWKFNSSDLQGKIKRDNTHKLRVYGWRIPFLNMYRNILSVD